MADFSSENFSNRELSWLEFNMRVLAEAESASVPLLERMKFCAIVSSNLDEFFMVRVAIALRAQASGKENTGPDSLTVTEMIQKISTKVHELVERQQKCFEKELLPRLKKEGIDFVRMEDYGRNDKKFLKT
jgi:polyphosphate kinase